MHVWRLQRSVHSPLDGKGAQLHGGRWNLPGRPVVYTSESLALGVLEVLVHLDSDLLPRDYAAYCIEIADNFALESLDSRRLPKGWQRSVVCRECLQAGDSWLDRGESAVLRVPSAVIPHAANYLINPRHDAATTIRVLSAEPFHFDSRLL